VGIVALIVVGLAAAAGVWRLSRGPVSFPMVADRIAMALADRFGDGYRVEVARAQLSWKRGPVLTVSDVVVKDHGRVVVAAPRAEIGFSPKSLVLGNIVPRQFSFIGLEVRLTIAPDGGVTIAAGAAETPPPAVRESVPMGEAAAPSAPDARFGPGKLIDAVIAPGGPMAVLQLAGIRDGRLRIDDRRRGHVMVYDDLAMRFEREAGGGTALSFSARGPSGPLAANARIEGTPGGRRSISVDTRDLALRDIIAVAEPGAVPFATDIKADAALSLSVDETDAIAAFDATIKGGAGTLLLDDPDATPFAIEDIVVRLGWNPARHLVDVQQLSLDSGATRLRFSGTVTPPSVSTDHWAIALRGPGSTWTPVGRGEPPIAIDTFDVDARMPIGLAALVVDRLEVKGLETNFRLSATFGKDGDFEGVRMNGSAGRMPARTLMAFWPNYLVRDVRKYLIEATQAGVMERFDIASSLTPPQLIEAKAKRPLPADVMQLDFAMSGAAMRLSPGVPVITEGVAEGTVTGRRAEVTVSRGRVSAVGGSLLIGQGRYLVADTSLHPTVADVQFGIAGDLEPMMSVLRSDGMKPFAALPSGLPSLKGQVEANIGLTMTLVDKIGPKDVVVKVTGTASNVSADAVFGKDRLEAGSFTLAQDKAGLAVKGDAKIGGSPATIDVRQPPGAPTAETTVVLTLDEAARARRGIKLPGTVTGPVDVKVVLHDQAPGKPLPPRIDVDLAKASLSDVLPGWQKPAGKPGKVAFKWVPDDGTVLLDEFSLDAAGGVAAKGSIRLSEDGGLVAARLAPVKLSPGDDLKVDAEKSAAGLRLVVRGTAFDARPMLKALVSPQDAGGPPSGLDVDLDQKVGAVTGQNGEVLSNSELKLAVRGGEIRDFRLTGRLGNGQVAGQSARAENGAPGFAIEAGDAGAVFRFLDIYKRMQGGALLAQLAGSSPRMAGTLSVNRFVLEDEPALARSLQPGQDATPAGGPNRVAFTKLKAGFSVGGGRLQFTDATMWGPSVGGTLEGTMDFGRDRVDLTGTFVPAYGLNNIFNRVPIVGPILGGGSNEGLFAVNFRITGRVSQPTLTINPLSAVAPGFLRKFFGVIGPDATSSTSAQQGAGADQLQ
jgi:hypothetical protein